MRAAIALSTFAILGVSAAMCADEITLDAAADGSEHGPADRPEEAQGQRVTTEHRQAAEPPSDRLRTYVRQERLFSGSPRGPRRER